FRAYGPRPAGFGGGLAAVDDPIAEVADGPLHVLADLVQVWVVPGDGKTRKAQVRELRTHGRVRITQEHIAADGRPIEPLELTGDRIHVEGRAERDQIVHVFGAPAHIRDRGVHISGAKLHLDRGANRAWVEGPGLLQLPVDETLDGRKLDTPMLLDVTWQEQMTFDGEAAKFFGHVEAKLADSTMLCQAMDVLLAERFSFTQSNSRRQKTETDRVGREGTDPRRRVNVSRVVCRDGVTVKSYEFLEGKLVAFTQARVAEFTLEQASGQTHAQGPGWIESWRHGRRQRDALVPTSTVRVNQAHAPPAGEWDYTRIDFAGRSEGNVRQRFSTFHDRVQVVYGPVEQWMQTIDPDRLPPDSGWMICRSLRVTSHQQTDEREAYHELLAEGNVKLHGRSLDRQGRREQEAQGWFQALADEVAYDESTDLYLLRSHGTGTVRIKRQKRLGDDAGWVQAQRFEFSPSRGSLNSFRTQTVDGLQ
ncbi:MAG: hypothetical protein ACREIV_04215, partial [Planctomycetaceae bacterium]